MCVIGLVAALAVGGCSGGQAVQEDSATPSTVDLIIRGGTILTMDPARSRADAVGVTGDKIVFIGAEEEVMRLASETTSIVDLGGAALLPGFADAHSHFFGRADAAGTDVQGVSDFILSLGITTTAEAWVDQSLLAELQSLAAQGGLKVRLSAYLAANNGCGEPLDEWWAEQRQTRTFGEMLRIGGVKIFSDGGSCNVPAVSYEYPGGHGNGDLYFTVDQLAELVGRVDAAGHQALIHALGDRAVRTALDALAQVNGDEPNHRRHRIDHTAVVGPDLRGRHGELSVVAVLPGAFGTCFLTGGNANFKYRTPEEYLDWEWPWRSLIEASPGAHFGWHADFPVFQPPGPVSSLYGFVTRAQVRDDGTVCEPTPAMAAEAIPVERALELMTTGSAYALFREKEVGQIVPGMLADFVVLSADPTAVPPGQLKDLEVWMTMVGGEAAWCAPGRQVFCQ